MVDDGIGTCRKKINRKTNLTTRHLFFRVLAIDLRVLNCDGTKPGAFETKIFGNLNESKITFARRYIYTVAHTDREYQSLATVHVEIKQRNESSKRWNELVNSTHKHTHRRARCLILIQTHQNKYSIVHVAWYAAADVRAGK